MLAIIMILSVALAACNSKNDESSPSSRPATASGDKLNAAGGNYTIGISLPAADHGWMGALISNTKTEAEKHKNIESIVYTAKGQANLGYRGFDYEEGRCHRHAAD